MKKTVIIVGALVSTWFIGVIVYNRVTFVDRNLRSEDKIDFLSEYIVYERGAIILSDSVVLEGNSFQFTEISKYTVGERNPPNYIYKPKGLKYRPKLYDLDGPYRIVKEPYNDTILIVKNGDSLYFEFLDPEKKDPSDPTFSDLFEKLFKSE